MATIGIDARILQGDRRGQGQYVHYLVSNLVRLDTRNEYVVFYNGFKKGAFVFDPADNLRQVWCRIPGRALKYMWSHWERPRVESLIGLVDIFHNPFNVNFTHHAPVPSAAPMVVTFNGMADPSTIWERFDETYIKQWFDTVARRASAVIAVSESVKNDLLKRAGIPHEKVKVIYYGVSSDFKPEISRDVVQAVLEKYGLSGRDYILYVGAAEKNKNLEGLLQAFAEVCRADTAAGTYLVLVGFIDGKYRRLMTYAQELGIRKRVIFTGGVMHDELPAIYNGARLFVLPTFHEWFGMPVAEAAACGIPVAASCRTGACEVLGDAVITFSPEDPHEMAECIMRMLRDNALRDECRQKGLQRVKCLTWEATARQTLAVYREAAGI